MLASDSIGLVPRLAAVVLRRGHHHRRPMLVGAALFLYIVSTHSYVMK